jgi:23S rRNA (cytosine1962-C5)-methyltransferase
MTEVRPVKKMASRWIDAALLRDFEAESTDAHRIGTTEDGWAERFGRDVLVSFRTEEARERLTLDLHSWAADVGFDCGRIFIRLLPRKNEERGQPHLLFGDAAGNLRTTAMERQLRFEIDFAAGYSVGLFVDQRENRAHLRKLAPKRVLNCFAYTCSFAVAAAAAGATTFNVDLSRKALARGRANFALNSLRTHDHQFIADDVLKVLPRLARRGEKFDAIILDPPTFAHCGPGKTFRVERDFEQLLLMALAVAARDGHILLATNCSELGRQALEVLARYCLKIAGRAAKLVHLPALPDFPAGDGASSLWLSLR